MQDLGGLMACLDAGRKPCLHSEFMVVSIPSWWE